MYLHLKRNTTLPGLWPVWPAWPQAQIFPALVGRIWQFWSPRLPVPMWKPGFWLEMIYFCPGLLTMVLGVRLGRMFEPLDLEFPLFYGFISPFCCLLPHRRNVHCQCKWFPRELGREEGELLRAQCWSALFIHSRPCHKKFPPGFFASFEQIQAQCCISSKQFAGCWGSDIRWLECGSLPPSPTTHPPLGRGHEESFQLLPLPLRSVLSPIKLIIPSFSQTSGGKSGRKDSTIQAYLMHRDWFWQLPLYLVHIWTIYRYKSKLSKINLHHRYPIYLINLNFSLNHH